MEVVSLNSPHMPPLPSERTRLVVLADVNAWAPSRAELPELDSAEKARVERLRFQPDRDHRELAYALHRMLASWWLGIPANSVVIGRRASGAPVVVDEHGNMLGQTSLSHASHYAAFAFAPPGERIGIDVEDQHAAVTGSLPDMRALILSPAESESGDDELLATWVRKEALVKATGQGLSVEMASFSARHAHPAEGLPGCSLRSWTLHPGPGSAAMLGWAADDAEGHLLELHPRKSGLVSLADRLSAG